MWVRKTAEEISTAPREEDNDCYNPFLAIVGAALFTGIVIFSSAPPPRTSAILFSIVFSLVYLLRAYLKGGFVAIRDSEIYQRNLETGLFCPACSRIHADAAWCGNCRGPLEPLAHWKWVEATPPRSEAMTNIPVSIETEPAMESPAINRQISISLPIPRRKLAALVGVTHSRLLKDLVTEDLFAAVNPRLSDRDVLTRLGRKYRIAFRFVG